MFFAPGNAIIMAAAPRAVQDKTPKIWANAALALINLPWAQVDKAGSLAVIWRIVKEKADEQVEDHPVSKAIARLTKQQATRLDGTHVIPRPSKASVDNFTNEQRKLHGGGGDWTLLPNRNGYFHYGGRTNFSGQSPNKSK